jgi:TolB-like protein
MQLRDELQSTLGDAYVIQEELKGAGMSRVFLASDERLGRQVVLKVLPPELLTTLSMERFSREIRIAAALQHPNIVPVLSAGGSGATSYYVMPYVKGESLRERVRRATPEQPISLPEIIRILREISRALAYAHRQGIVHRDIKPGNILLSDDGVSITDFGVAKALALAHAESPPLTGNGTTVGTLSYMAPEQAAGDPAMDHRVDIYAFGAVAYELLAGEPPFARRSPAEMMVSHAVADPVPVTSLRRDVPAPLAALVAQCLAKNPSHRPHSADVLHALLEPRSRLESSRTSGRRFLAAGIVAAVLVALLVAFIPADTRGMMRTLFARASPVLVAQRYVVAPFENHTGRAELDALGYETADWIAQGLARIPGVEVVDARTTWANTKVVDRIPWPLRSAAKGKALAEESGAALLITGMIYATGDSLRMRAEMSNVRTGAVAQPVREVSGRVSQQRALIIALAERVVATVSFISDTGVVAVPGSYSHPPSLDAYQELIRGMQAYFADDTSMYTHLRRAEQLDSGWATPTVFLAYLDGWYSHPADFARDTLRARRLEHAMTPAERALAEYSRALGRADLHALLPAATQFMRNTPGSMESPLLFSSTANGMREPRAALDALDRVDPDRGLNLKGAYYWQSRIGAHQHLGRSDLVLDDAREAERRFPGKILFRIYEARVFAARRDLKRLDACIAAAQLEHRDDEQARMIVAAHAVAAFATSGDRVHARAYATRWWPSAARSIDDTNHWVQEAVANIALLADRHGDLASLTRRMSAADGRPYFERLSYSAVGYALGGNAAEALRIDSVLAAAHPDLDYGARELQRARIAAQLNDSAKAIALLARAMSEGALLKLLWGHGFNVDPFLSPLRDNREFRDLTLRGR